MKKINNTDIELYDWGNKRDFNSIKLVDEGLRDGIQSPFVRSPAYIEKCIMLSYMEKIGIDSVNLGFPATSCQVYNDVIGLAKEIKSKSYKINAQCAGRTLVEDIEPILNISQKTSLPIEICTFIASSGIRYYVGNNSLDNFQRIIEKTINFAKKESQQVMFITEDTTRASPENIKSLYLTAVNSGADRVCICDTVGAATPSGVKNIVHFLRNILDSEGFNNVGIDFHAHNDRGYANINSLVALISGAERVHGTPLGVGERSGNADIGQLLVNLYLEGNERYNLSFLKEYMELSMNFYEIQVAQDYPMFGEHVFSTATGIHANVIAKALELGDLGISDVVYSGVPASLVGRTQKIGIGPQGGRSNIRFILLERGISIENNSKLVNFLFNWQKKMKRPAFGEEIDKVISEYRGEINYES